MPDDPPIDQLILWSCSVRTSQLVEFSDWSRNGKQTGQYVGPRPSYRLRFDWRGCDVKDQMQLVNTAIERCSGSKDSEDWDLWDTGAQLALLARYIRMEYLKLEEAGCVRYQDLGDHMQTITMGLSQ
jgi:hypothetical protein